MDLLLHLIAKHKLNIYDIPIFELVEQYTAYIRTMQELDLEIASEFLEMAARLVHIKSLSLLPVHEEGEQLRRELTGEDRGGHELPPHPRPAGDLKRLYAGHGQKIQAAAPAL